MFPLLQVALFFQLGAAMPGAMNAGCAASAEAESRCRKETRLLHLALDRVVLNSFPVWDQNSNELREVRPGERLDDSTPVIIIHLWATWCQPCKAEFPIWRELGTRLWDRHRGRVHVFHIAMQESARDMAKFVSQIPGKLPRGMFYFDRGERLAKNLLPAFDGKRIPPLPATLFLDADRVVRQAIIGPINERRFEVEEVAARMMRLVEHQEAARLRPKPPEEEIDVFTSPR